MRSSSSAAAGLASDEAYAEAMHAILSSEPCRGLVTEPTRLLAHVFIGSQSNAEDLTTMRRLGISHVLNCAGYKGPRPAANASPYDGLGIEYYEFKAEDSDRYDITRHFGEAFRFLDAAKRDGGVVLVHCALGINRSAAVCVAYMMVDRRMPLLAVTRVIKDRRRIVLANKSFQRQLVGFARARGLLGDLPRDEKGKDDDDGDDDRLSGTVRRLTLHRVSDGVDWRFNGLNIDTGHRLDTSASYRTRSTGEWRSSVSRSDDRGGMNTHDSRGFRPTSSRYDYVGTAGDFSPHRRLLPHSVATRSRETDDVMPSYVSPRQYRASKSATSLVPVSSSGRHNRFAFRPTGSTTAAIISLLHTVTSMLQSNPFVIVISLDFSKAFDTIRHFTLLNKMAELDLPLPVYNWLVSFFNGHTHRTVYNGDVSSTMTISASIVQGSSLGPASYAVTAVYLKPLHAGNQFVKFADDAYLIVPADSVQTRAVELDIAAWATENNLTLKTKEVIFHDSRRRHSVQSPTLLTGVAREFSLKVLGVTLSSNLSASDHIRRVISDSAQSVCPARPTAPRYERRRPTNCPQSCSGVEADVRLARMERFRNGDGP